MDPVVDTHNVIPYAGQHIVVFGRTEQMDRLDLLIGEWLLEKYRQTQSVKTRDSYRTTLNQYRDALQRQGLDLDRVDCLDKLVTTARLFSTFSARGKEVTIATSNLRLSVLSSFYEFALRNDLVSINPIDKIKRGKTQRYQGAHAMQPEQVQALLRSIDAAINWGHKQSLTSARSILGPRKCTPHVIILLQGPDKHATHVEAMLL